MKISRVKIKIENNDGTYDEVTTIMPNEIAEKIRYGMITWKDDWLATTNTVEEYKKAEKEFVEKPKQILMKREEEEYYWCKIQNKWDIFTWWPEGEKWYDGKGDSYNDQDFDEIDERQIRRKGKYVSLQEIKEKVAENYDKNWERIQYEFENGIGISKTIDFESLMDVVATEYQKSNTL